MSSVPIATGSREGASLIVRYISPELAIGIAGDIIVVAWSAKPTVELLDIVDEHIGSVVHYFTHKKMFILIDIDPNSGVPDRDTQQRQQRLLEKYAQSLAGCSVLLPVGFRFVGLLMSAWGLFAARLAGALPMSFTTSRQSAIKWLVERSPLTQAEDIEGAVRNLRDKM